MLNIRNVKHLAITLGFPVERLREIADHADEFAEQFEVIDPVKPEKTRSVINVVGDLRRAQNRLLREVLIPRLKPSPFAHGGIRGRHIKSNIQEHSRSVFVTTMDICNFYPTVYWLRVYDLMKRMGCTPDVARLLTRLCTWRHHLALGLVTSPFIAEQILIPIDARIGAACTKAGLVYTRYVDDIAISGSFDLKKGGFQAVVRQILNQNGFHLHPRKTRDGRLSQGTPITKITLRRGTPDVSREYLDELDRQLDDARSLSTGGPFTGPFYLRNQIVGRVRFVCWIRSGRQRRLISKMNSINWDAVAKEGAARGLIVAKTRLVRKDPVTPSLAV